MPKMDANGFPVVPSMADPADLIAMCVEMAAGMDQQIIAANPNSAMGGHPRPAELFGRAANVFRACANMLRTLIAAENTTGSPGTVPSTPATPGAGAGGVGTVTITGETGSPGRSRK